MSRLPRYQRVLAEMLEQGRRTVSSEELADGAGVNAAKVRKDFSFFGSFGTRGTGYEASFLAAQIDRALGVDRDWPVVIVGIGNLGRALANSESFVPRGFRVSGLFDVDPSVVGTRVGTRPVLHLDELSALGPEDSPALGVVATPAAAAQAVADALVAAGARAILNFAPRVIAAPASVRVRYVDLSVELQVLGFLVDSTPCEAPSSDRPEPEPGRTRAAVLPGLPHPGGQQPDVALAGRDVPGLRGSS